MKYRYWYSLSVLVPCYISSMEYRPLVPSDLSRDQLSATRAKSFVSALLIRARAGDDNPQALANASRVNGDIERVVKGSISSLSTGDTSALAAFNNAGVGWLQSLQTAGVFDRMIGDGAMLVAPMKTRFGTSTIAIVASEIAEGLGIPVARLTIDGSDPLEPRKVGVIVVSSKELLRLSEAGALIDREMRAGVIAGVDYAFLHDLYNSTIPTASSGNSVTDIGVLFNGVTIGAQSRLYFVFHANALKTFALEFTNGVPSFPELTATGGRILGVPVLTTDQIAQDVAMLIDAAAIAAAPGTVELDTSNQADVQLSTAPTIRSVGGTPVPAQLTSLFMTNSSAVRGTRLFSFKLLRDNAVASLSGVNY